MNKQQLAAKIWQSANQMRSKIEANEYKDYILGFIFYKYLSDKLVRFARDEAFTEDEIKALSEEDAETVEHIKSNIGYFIAYPHLFSTWIEHKGDFDVSHEYMRIDLGGGHILMAQQLLHRADISACLYKVRRETVPQRVGTDRLDDVGPLGSRTYCPL